VDGGASVGYISPMQLLTGKSAAAHISGILYPKFQIHGFSVHLSARKIFAIEPTGQIDFGGNEYIPAGRIELPTHQLRQEDNYRWWELSRGCYFVQCNEGLNLGSDEIAMIEPEDRLLRAGAWHVPLYLRGHVSPVELLVEVGAEKLRVKENARLSHVRLFRIEVGNSPNGGSRKAASSGPKREKSRK
jgi:hypothetical protein